MRSQQLIALAVVALTACSESPSPAAFDGRADLAVVGEPGGPCFANHTCFPGARCQDGLCVAGDGDAGVSDGPAEGGTSSDGKSIGIDAAIVDKGPVVIADKGPVVIADKGPVVIADKGPVVIADQGSKLDQPPVSVDASPSPCAGVSCTAVPAPACVGSSLRTYVGTCVGGVCSYPYTETLCPGGCVAGACQPPSCAGQTCNTPPASSCLNTSVLQTYAPQGVCKTNVCEYQKTPVACSLGCLNGSCLPGSWQTLTPPIGIIGTDYESHNLAVDAANQVRVVGCKAALHHAYWTPAGWVVDTVDNVSGCSFDFLITPTGQTVIAYYDPVNKDLRVARSQAGGKYSIELVDSTGDVGRNPAVTLLGGSLLIAYNDLSKMTLKLAREASGGWTSWAGPSGVEVGKYGNQHSLLIDAQQQVHLLSGDAVPWQFPINYGFQYRTVPVVHARRSAAGVWTKTTLGSKGGIVPKSRGLAHDPTGQLRALWIEVPQSSSYPTARPLMLSTLSGTSWSSKYLYQTNTLDERSGAIFLAAGHLGLAYIHKVVNPYTSFVTEYMKQDAITGQWSQLHSYQSFFKDVAVGPDGKARLLVNGSYQGPQIIVPP